MSSQARLKKTWFLMEKANRVAPFGSPVQRCHNVPIGQVNVIRNPERPEKLFYGGLKVCRNAWACPICSPRKAAEKAEIVKLMAGMIVNKPVMVTYTLQHNRHDSLNELLNTLTTAMRVSRNGKRLAKYKRTCLGYIRSTEITYSPKNGWHPHYHELNFLNRGQSVEDMTKGVIRDYISAIEKSGKIVNGFTVDTKEWNHETDYLTKGSSISLEMVNGINKSGKNSLNIFDILNNAEIGYGLHRNLYLEFLHATHRRKCVVISRSLDQWRIQAESQASKNKVKVDANNQIVLQIDKSTWDGIRSKPMLRYDVLVSLQDAR